MSFFGSFPPAPQLSSTGCPHCGTVVDLTRYGTLAAHRSRRGGASCSGTGLPATATPPWPGTAPRVASAGRSGSPRRRRRERAQEATPTAV
ncbi:hypothetical protein LQF12_04320 [Ruania suaedae]|uniref:hypothetical protein n=1 Tax=Ruania suaedae TaxID=2897774 RepID=UPI001E2C7286|nr:hypothetical protein [Ruania suaedae]UFU03839.1 hypothetical protein LQF12_04320 [Ruania suaedae]